ncbi:MAG TPA: hydrogenase maturation nickel metallochaperone HypA [Candidatus Lokiarchaeia archaeon]|nr:hydrogenase maturation nickel metallochaperone HypA [Candidatus Lokiarchaeia archaeon]
MHEFSFASTIVDVVMQNVQKNNVKKVMSVLVEVGEFTMIIPDFLRNSYDIIKENYPELAESKIIIRSVPGQVQCSDCGAITEISFKKASEDTIDASLAMMNPGAFICQNCKGSKTNIVSGRQALVKSMKVDA